MKTNKQKLKELNRECENLRGLIAMTAHALHEKNLCTFEQSTLVVNAKEAILLIISDIYPAANIDQRQQLSEIELKLRYL